MKRFMKGCAVTALVFGVLGFVLVMAGGSMVGRNTIARVVEEATGGRVQMNTGVWGNWGYAWKSDFFDGEFDNVLNSELDFGIYDDIEDYGNAEAASFDVDYQVYRGDVEKYSPGSGFANLDIEVGGCIFETKPSDDSSVYLQAEKAHRFQGYVEGGTLYIRAEAGAVEDWKDFGKCRITLYLPEKYCFDNVDINVGAGTLDFEGLQAGEVYLEVGAGQIVLDEVRADTLTMSVGAGRIMLKDMEVACLDAEVGMGEFAAEGAVGESAYIGCSMGNVDLELEGREKDFNYYISNSMGNVDLGDRSFGGLGSTKDIDNGVEKVMTVECAMGNISIEFKD